MTRGRADGLLPRSTVPSDHSLPDRHPSLEISSIIARFLISGCRQTSPATSLAAEAGGELLLRLDLALLQVLLALLHVRLLDVRPYLRGGDSRRGRGLVVDDDRHGRGRRGSVGRLLGVGDDDRTLSDAVATGDLVRLVVLDRVVRLGVAAVGA